MEIQAIYAAIAAKDLKASEAFYTRLFGRAPDDWPMETLIQWRGVAGANVQVFLSDKNAGASMATIVVPNMAETRSFLEGLGVSLRGERQGDFGRIAHVTDPAGNELTLAEPPSSTPGH